MKSEKESVRNFWNVKSCGEELYLRGEDDRSAFKNQMHERYKLEPYILQFANFQNAKNKRFLEIGVELVSDHKLFAESETDLYGIDLTERALTNTRKRLGLFGQKSN